MPRSWRATCPTWCAIAVHVGPLALALDLERHRRSRAPGVSAAIPYVLWGIFLRTTVGLHATWLVNSATHKWGSRRFDTRDDSTNNWWVALLTFGEGWHNNHHAHPTSARHGLAWYEVDLNWIGIRTLRALGLAWDVKRANYSNS